MKRFKKKWLDFCLAKSAKSLVRSSRNLIRIKSHKNSNSLMTNSLLFFERTKKTHLFMKYKLLTRNCFNNITRNNAYHSQFPISSIDRYIRLTFLFFTRCTLFHVMHEQQNTYRRWSKVDTKRSDRISISFFWSSLFL